MSVYYNEHDKFAAAWLRELIKANLIAPGDVDERSITEVAAADVRGYTQAHFFAGIGGWSHALRLAGFPDDRSCWTGSCPCQPWSVAGSGAGADDPRDLWPTWFRLIEECRPAVIFSEQSASPDGLYWLDRVYVALEDADYAVGAADLCAAGATAPHLRQRLYIVADTERVGVRGARSAAAAGSSGGHQDPHGQRQRFRSDAGAASVPHGVAVAECAERRSEAEVGIALADGANAGRQEAPGGHRLCGADADNRVADANGGHGFWWSGPLQVGWNTIEGEIKRGGRRYRAQWRTQPGVPLLADGIPKRVELLRGFGNAIVPPLAQAFIESYLEVTGTC